MGYTIFTIVFLDGSRQACVTETPSILSGIQRVWVQRTYLLYFHAKGAEMTPSLERLIGIGVCILNRFSGCHGCSS